jgi:hypothetical protein
MTRITITYFTRITKSHTKKEAFAQTVAGCPRTGASQKDPYARGGRLLCMPRHSCHGAPRASGGHGIDISHLFFQEDVVLVEVLAVWA